MNPWNGANAIILSGSGETVGGLRRFPGASAVPTVKNDARSIGSPCGREILTAIPQDAPETSADEELRTGEDVARLRVRLEALDEEAGTPVVEPVIPDANGRALEHARVPLPIAHLGSRDLVRRRGAYEQGIVRNAPW